MKELRKLGCVATEIDRETPGYPHIKTVYITTFHAAKGLEFDNVFIPFLSEGLFPDKEIEGDAESVEELFADELKLLYVAATRSRYGLYMSYHEKLSEIFPTGTDSYELYDGEE